MYNPSPRIKALIPKIESMYYTEKKSMLKIARQLGIDGGTVSRVVNKSLHGKISRSERAKEIYKRLNQETKEKMLAAAARKRRTSHSYKEKLSKTKEGTKNHQAKLTEKEVLEIREEYRLALENGEQKTATQVKLAKKHKVKRPTISDIVLRRTWKHI